MMIYKMMADQLAKPDGLIGRLFTGRILARGNQSLNAWTLAQLPIQAGDCVLDLGCGPGAGLRQIALRSSARLVAGTDYSRLMAGQAQAQVRDLVRQQRVLVTQGDAAALGYRSATFDHVLAVNVVYFWPDPVAALREIQRILKPGGRLALGFRPKAVVDQLRFQEAGYRSFAEADLRDLAQECGFTDLKLLAEPNPPRMAGVCLVGVKG